MRDQELVKLAQIQLPHTTIAFEVLLNKYQNKIYSICKRVLQDDHLAEDATQNTMLNIFHYLKSFNMNSSFYTWVYKISYNESLKILNKNNMQKLVLDYNDQLHICDNDIELKIEIESIIKQLLPEEQDILMMKYWLELKDEEIAENLNLKLSATKMRIARIKEKCKTFI